MRADVGKMRTCKQPANQYTGEYSLVDQCSCAFCSLIPRQNKGVKENYDGKFRHEWSYSEVLLQISNPIGQNRMCCIVGQASPSSGGCVIAGLEYGNYRTVIVHI